MRNCLRTMLIGWMLLSVTLASSTHARAEVKVWDGTISIPTYQWHEPDVNPKFFELEGSIVYPYPMQDSLGVSKQKRSYKALFLENEYLKITCLPELGGRLHSVLDKTSGKEMFYRNGVIKPGMIGLRGAWISGGVEWNSGPHGHTVTILSPVNALTRKNGDGSATLEISNLEKISRIRWNVRITLRPGKSYLEEDIRIFNPMDTPRPYYFWNCTAFPCGAGTQFIYPMVLGTDHGGRKFFDWPFHEGKNLSCLKNYDEPTSIFAHKCEHDFFGAYDMDEDRGIVQVSDHHELSGKKAWTWGTSQFAQDRQNTLTDNDGPYIEVQSGPLPTQSDYGMLAPRAEVAWRECWYPVHGLGGGYQFANRNVAIRTIRHGKQLLIRLAATGEFPKATCSVFFGGRSLTEEEVSLSPKKPATLLINKPHPESYDITIKDASGAVLASCTLPLSIPAVEPPDDNAIDKKSDDILTPAEAYLKGRKRDLASDRTGARKYYKQALEKDCNHVPSLRAIAVLDIKAGFYRKATDKLRKALRRDSQDGLSWFYLGLSELKLGNTKETLRCAYLATRCMGTDSLGYDLAGRAYMLQSQTTEAIEAFKKAVRLNPVDTRAKDHLLLACHANGQTDRAIALAEKRIRHSALDLLPRIMTALYCQNQTGCLGSGLKTFLGEEEFEMQEIGLICADLGMYCEAGRILKAAYVEAESPLARKPLPFYYMAYFAARCDDENASKSFLMQAAELSWDYVFPSRPEELGMLLYAVETNPKDDNAFLYLGNLYAGLGRIDDAAINWKRSAELDKSQSVALRNLGLYSWKKEKDLPVAVNFYLKAIKARPDDQTLYRDLARIILAQGERRLAIRVMETVTHQSFKRSDLVMELAQAYVADKQFDKAINLFNNASKFVNLPAESEAGRVLGNAYFERGKQHLHSKRFKEAMKDFDAALSSVEKLRLVSPKQPWQSQVHYHRGKTFVEMGRVAEALAAWRKGADGENDTKNKHKWRQACQTMLLVLELNETRNDIPREEIPCHKK